MFCTYCRGPLQPDQQYCGRCGNPAAPYVPSAHAAGRVASHARTLGMLWIAFSALHLLRGGGVLLGARMVRLIGNDWSDEAPWAWPAGDVFHSFLSFLGRCRLDGGDRLLADSGYFGAPSLGAQSGHCAGSDCAAPSAIWNGPRNLHALGAAAYGIRGRISTRTASVGLTVSLPTRSKARSMLSQSPARLMFRP